jgi:hypothetical protein
MRVCAIAIGIALVLGGVAAAQDASGMLSRLHDDLRLSAAQEGAWRQYETAMSQAGQAQARHLAAQQLMPQVPTPRRLALIDATMTQDLEDFHRQSQAIAAFYDRLTPTQQRTFDAETLPSGQGDPR